MGWSLPAQDRSEAAWLLFVEIFFGVKRWPGQDRLEEWIFVGAVRGSLSDSGPIV